MDKKDIRNMGTKQYIEYKHGEYESVLQAENIQDGELLEYGFQGLIGQIYSGRYMGLTAEQIEIYADLAKRYSYEKREIIKQSLYEGASDELINRLRNCENRDELLTARREYYRTDSVIEHIGNKVDALKTEVVRYEKLLAEYSSSIAGLKEQLLIKEQIIFSLRESLDSERRKRNKRDMEYDVISGNKAEPEEEHRFFFKRRKKNQETKTGKYIRRTETIKDYTSLEEYAIEKQIPAEVAYAVTFAIKNKIDDSLIISMIENGLSAKKITGVVEIIIAKRENRNKMFAGNGNTESAVSSGAEETTEENTDSDVSSGVDPLALDVPYAVEDIDVLYDEEFHKSIL